MLRLRKIILYRTSNYDDFVGELQIQLNHNCVDSKIVSQVFDLNVPPSFYLELLIAPFVVPV